MSDAEVAVPDRVTPENIDDLSKEQIRAYNEQKEAELAERLGDLEASEQDAVEFLRGQQEQTEEHETVILTAGDTDQELTVRARLTSGVEDLQQEVGDSIHSGSVAEARQAAAELIAEMVVAPEEYTNPRVWVLAAQYESGGIQWLTDVMAEVLDPALSHAEDTKGKLQRLND